MSIIVPFDDKSHKIYPLFESGKRSPCRNNSIQYKECNDIRDAQRFYMAKFSEYHPSIIRQVSREVTR